MSASTRGELTPQVPAARFAGSGADGRVMVSACARSVGRTQMSFAATVVSVYASGPGAST